jgi:hypothetical protein
MLHLHLSNRHEVLVARWLHEMQAAVPGGMAGLFEALDRRYPGLRFRVVDERGELRANMRLFVNGQGVRDLGFGLKPGDFVAVVLALSGG